jgi:hypothetical protein
MSDTESPRPLNICKRLTTIEEFTHYCHDEKERRMNSGNEFDEAAFEAAKQLTLTKLQVLQDEGWV